MTLPDPRAHLEPAYVFVTPRGLAELRVEPTDEVVVVLPRAEAEAEARVSVGWTGEA